jgi:hypothetical protein
VTWAYDPANVSATESLLYVAYMLRADKIGEELDERIRVGRFKTRHVSTNPRRGLHPVRLAPPHSRQLATLSDRKYLDGSRMAGFEFQRQRHLQ